MPIDLHVHTSYSDGLLSPQEILVHASRIHLSYLSITDHDTFRGFQEALSILESDSSIAPEVTLIPGVEISCIQDGRDVHLLAYYIEHPSIELLDELAEARRRRHDRTLQIIDMLQNDDYPISRSSFDASGLMLNRTNIARYLIEKGCIKSTDEFFNTMVGKGCKYFIPRREIDVVSAIRLVRDSNGLPIIAHPALNGVIDLIQPLTDIGLAGVEAYHASQPIETAEKLQGLAESLGLLVTGEIARAHV